MTYSDYQKMLQPLYDMLDRQSKLFQSIKPVPVVLESPALEQIRRLHELVTDTLGWQFAEYIDRLNAICNIALTNPKNSEPIKNDANLSYESILNTGTDTECDNPNAPPVTNNKTSFEDCTFQNCNLAEIVKENVTFIRCTFANNDTVDKEWYKSWQFWLPIAIPIALEITIFIFSYITDMQ